MAATGLSTRQPAMTEPPRSVRTATTILYVLIGLALVRPVAFVAVAVASLLRGNTLNRDVIIILAISLAAIAVGWFYLLLIKKTRKGRRWAWITLLVLLGLLALLGAGVLATTGASDAVAAGAAMTLVPLVLIGLLAGPRRARAYYTRAPGIRS